MLNRILSAGGELTQYGRFRFEIPENRPNVWVLVMGLTGAGKSSFIRDALGVDDPSLSPVCHGLEPCTASVTVTGWLLKRHPKVHLVLVDTPGFDDTHREDKEILEEILAELAGIFKSGETIGSIIYVHRISDNRLQRGALRSISILREIVGRDKFPGVIFATTWWDGVNIARAAQREAELSRQGNYWGAFIKGGARVMRHDKGEESAKKIIDEAISRATFELLKIQSEMITNRLSFKDTSAMLALESFDFLEKLQNGYAKGLISISEYEQEIRNWVRRKKQADAKFWDKYGGDVIGVFSTVAQTAILGMTGGLSGGLEAVVVGAIAEAARRYLDTDDEYDVFISFILEACWQSNYSEDQAYTNMLSFGTATGDSNFEYGSEGFDFSAMCKMSYKFEPTTTQALNNIHYDLKGNPISHNSLGIPLVSGQNSQFSRYIGEMLRRMQTRSQQRKLIPKQTAKGQRK